MKMLKRALSILALGFAAVVGTMPAALAIPLPIGGPWVVLDENMKPGDFFSGSWTINCPTSHCKFWITDLFVVSDQFEIYDFGQLIATTPKVPDWNDRGIPDPFTSPPWTNNPDVAWASGDFSHLLVYLSTGVHEITIRDIHIPLQAIGGPVFPDGTVAFRVTVPEPGTLALLGLALAGFGWSRRKRS